MSNDEFGISDNVLQKAQEDINKLLANKRLSSSDRLQLEIQSYFLMFLISDHKKVGKMYPFYLEQKERDRRRAEWWSRFQWVVIPFIVGTMLAFLGQAVYFWIAVVPQLMGK